MTATETGLYNSDCASAAISGGMVAVKNIVCRFFGSSAITFLTSWMNPISSMRSASSSTKKASPSSRIYPCACRSSSRPGVDTSISTPFFSISICAPGLIPPISTPQRYGRYLPYALIDSSICSASSRVGVSISARMPPRGLFVIRLSTGSENAAVFPVPVCAQPSTSLPSSAGGMAFSCMGDGVTYPASATASSILRSSFSSSNRKACLSPLSNALVSLHCIAIRPESQAPAAARPVFVRSQRKSPCGT